MKLLKILILGFTIIFISFSSFIVYNKDFNNYSLEKEILNHLQSIAQSKSERVGMFLDERKNDLEYLANSPEIINLFSSDGTSLNEQINDKLIFYWKTNEYIDLVLMDIDGKILWSAKKDITQGVDLNQEQFKSTKYGEIFHKVKKDFGVGIFDPGYYGDEDFLSVFVTSPILVNSKTIENKKEMLGIIALQIDNKQIESKVVNNFQNPSSDIVSTNIYLVNRDGTIINNMIDRSNKIVTKIDTQMYVDCFDSYNNYYQKLRGDKYTQIKQSSIYSNYENKKVFGAHHYILETGLCVIVEVDKNKYYLNHSSNKKLVSILLILSIICILSLLGFSKYCRIS
ncbi:MAG: cache domain-containing protein, partial [Nanoarchaeales archaeon]|nr:cache domain-containing protein [Nanoarchaeales archaeon]